MWKRRLAMLAAVLLVALALVAATVYGMVYYVRHSG